MWEKLNAAARVSRASCESRAGGSAGTAVVEVLAKLHVAVAAGGDVEVALDLVAVEAAEDAARVCGAPDARRLGELLLLLDAQVVVHLEVVHVPAASDLTSIQLMHALLSVLARPLRPARGVLAQQIASERAVASGVLHVDVQVGAPHADDDVEVDLHVVRDALLDGKRLGCGAREPARGFGPCQPDACEDERDSPSGRVAALHEVRLLRFGCRSQYVYRVYYHDKHPRNASKLLTMPPLDGPNASSSSFCSW
jgi:hypothetical protein